MPSHKIASRQAELARKKRKHHEPHPAAEALQSNPSAQNEAGTAAAPVNIPEEVRARPSLMSSYKAVSTQPGSTKGAVTRSMPTAQAEYFSADMRRLLLTIGICSVILAVLTFVLR